MSGQQSTGPGIGPRHGERSIRVLIIDDNAIDREIIIRHVRQAWPFEDVACESAEDGNEAVRKLAQGSYTAVVLDWQLPKSRGVDVLRKLRANGVDTPVIVVSGLRREEIADDLESLGVVFLNKEAIKPTSLRDAMAASARWLTDGRKRRHENGEREL